MERMWREDKMP